MTLALIAGQGGLPPHLLRSLLARGEVPVICEMEQYPSSITEDLPRVTFRLETLGTFLAMLGEVGITQICMAGAMRRPPIDPGKIDAATAPLIGPLQEALAKGDDGTLRAFIDLFETRGIKVIGASDIAPDLLPEAGVLTKAPLPDGVEDDLRAAQLALQEMARADLGQAVLVKSGRVLAREDDRGTDALLDDHCPDIPTPGFPDGWEEVVGLALSTIGALFSDRQADGAPDYPAEGAILYKAPKPGQELRVDMPVIGPQTAMKAAEAGLSAIVIEAGGVMVMNLPGVLEILDAHGVALWVRP